MNMDALHWDSEFFGLKVGKVVVDEAENFDPDGFLALAEKGEYSLVYLESHNNPLPWSSTSRAEIELMDIHMTMEKKLDRSAHADGAYDFRHELTAGELRECYRVAERTSIVSRFSEERMVGPAITAAMYRKWVDNALNGSHSDGLFLVKTEGVVRGIHLIRTVEGFGYFTLTGVDPSCKRAGLGSILWNQSYAYWSNETDISVIRSPFSFRNTESHNFHLKHAFNRVIDVKYIYHYRSGRRLSDAGTDARSEESLP
jgi:ribosomal protein S18 acetylase RimI-like enzyme